MEAKLQEVWGRQELTFCRDCGTPTSVSNCDCDNAAAWSELNERQRTLVRWHTIRKAKADRLAGTVLTLAS